MAVSAASTSGPATEPRTDLGAGVPPSPPRARSAPAWRRRGERHARRLKPAVSGRGSGREAVTVAREVRQKRAWVDSALFFVDVYFGRDFSLEGRVMLKLLQGSGLHLIAAGVALILCSAFSSRSEASTVDWVLHDGAFSDGGTVSGSFVWDSTLNTVTSWNFVVSAGSNAYFSADTYSTSTSTFSSSDINKTTGDTLIFHMGSDTARKDLRFGFADLALNTPAASLLPVGNSYSGTNGYIECINFYCSTEQRNGVVGAYFSASTVPLPAALPLLASGLGGLGLVVWRKKRKTAAAVAH